LQTEASLVAYKVRGKQCDYINSMVTISEFTALLLEYSIITVVLNNFIKKS